MLDQMGRRGAGPSEMEPARHIADALGWPLVDLREYRISCGILARIPAELACRVRCVPMVHNAHRVVLVVDDPWNAAYIEVNQQLLGPPYRYRLEFAFTTPAALDACLSRRLSVVRG